MYWKGLIPTVQLHVKKCHSCQVNKLGQHKYKELPLKPAITNTWEALCVDLTGPHALKGMDKAQIDFMDVTILTEQLVGLKLLSFRYHSHLCLTFPWVKRGNRATNTQMKTTLLQHDISYSRKYNHRTWCS